MLILPATFTALQAILLKRTTDDMGREEQTISREKKNKQGIERTKQNRKPMTRQDAITEEVLKSGPF